MNSRDKHNLDKWFFMIAWCRARRYHPTDFWKEANTAFQAHFKHETGITEDEWLEKNGS